MGNLAACRDEGHSRDYVKAMYMMLHNENGPTDYVVSTGVTVSIETMFKYVCEDLAGLKFEDVYQVNPKYMRPSEVHYLVGNSNKIKEELGWEPNYTWKDTLREMYESDVKSVR
jgi:GDPmannose 4,6-dehydratase